MAYARLQYARKHFSRPGPPPTGPIAGDAPPAAVRAAPIPWAHAIVERAGLRDGAQRACSAAPSPRSAARRSRVAPTPPDRTTPRGPQRSWACRSTGSDQAALTRLFLEGARAGNGGWVVTPNLDILRRFNTDRESRELILGATHRVADGLPIVWASRLAGTPLPERVPGSDLVLSLPRAAARAGLSVFLLGGNPGAAAAAARRLEALCPGLERSGVLLPPVRIRGRSRGARQDQAGAPARATGAGAGRARIPEAGAADPLAPIRAARRPGSWGSGSRSASSPRSSRERRSRCSDWAWSGCTGSCTNRAGCSGATSSTESRSGSGSSAGRLRNASPAGTEGWRRARGRGTRTFFRSSAISSSRRSHAHTRHRSQRLHRLSARPRARAGRPRGRRARLRPLRRLHLRRRARPRSSRCRRTSATSRARTSPASTR